MGYTLFRLANTTEPSIFGGEAAFLSNYLDHLFFICMHHVDECADNVKRDAFAAVSSLCFYVCSTTTERVNVIM